MKSSLYKLTVFIFALIIVPGCGKNDTQPQVTESQFSFKLQSVIGDVRITGASGTKTASAGDTVSIKDIIITGKSSIADLLYGTIGLVRVQENSKVTVSSIADKAGSDTTVDMNGGKVYLTLSKLKGTGFKVKTPTAVASVRGTSFTVTDDKNGSKLAVLKGTVRVNPVKKGEIIENKSVEVDAGKTTDYISTKTVDQVLLGKTEIKVATITKDEMVKIQDETKTIKINEIKALDESIKDELIIDVSAPEKEKKEVRKDEKKEIKKDTKADAKAAELLKQKEKEEELRKAAEAKKLKEEAKAKEEKIKKERASNIPNF